MGVGEDAVPYIGGKLTDLHPARLLYVFFKAQKTGILTLSEGGNNFRIFLQEGVPICIPELMESDMDLAGYMVSEGLLDREDVPYCWKRAEERGTTFVGALLQKGLFERRTWIELANKYYAQRLIDIFEWKHGGYTFSEGGFDPGAADLAPGVVARIVLRGIRQKYNPQWVLQRLASYFSVKAKPYRKSLFEPEDLNLNAKQARWLSLLNEGRTLEEVIFAEDYSPSDAACFVYGVLILEMVKINRKGAKAGKERKKSRTTSGALEAAFEEALQAVEKYEITSKRPSAEAIQSLMWDDVPESVDVAEPPDESREYPLEEEPEAEESEQPEIEEQAISPDEVTEVEDAGTEDRQDETEDSEETELEVESAPEPEPEIEWERDQAQTESEPSESLPRFEEGQEADEFQIPEAAGFEDAAQDRPVFTPEQDGESIHKLGVMYLEAMNYPFARMAFEEAINRNFCTNELLAYLGWATYMSLGQGAGLDEALKIVRESIARSKENYLPYLIMGRIYKEEGDLELAELSFIKAHELNKDCNEAKEAIRKIHERK